MVNGYSPARAALSPPKHSTALFPSGMDDVLPHAIVGDIVPVPPVARILAALEAITGALFLAVLIARLVALY
jgi:hypothetical protein